MSKFSSYKESQLLFESWRGHINEAACLPRKRFPNGKCPDTHHSKGDLCCQTTSESVEELDEQSQLPPEASEILNQLKAMKTREPEAFTMAMGALQSMGEGV